MEFKRIMGEVISERSEPKELVDLYYRDAAECLAQKLLKEGFLEKRREVDYEGRIHYIVIGRFKKVNTDI